MIQNLASDEKNVLEILPPGDILVNHSIDAIITIDTRSRVTLWNKAAEDMFNYEQEEAKGKSIAELIIPPEYRQSHYNGINRYIETGQGPWLNKTVELVAQKRDGTIFPIELSLFVSSVKPSLQFTGIIRDISIRKSLEEALWRKNEELEFQVSTRTAELRRVLDRERLAREITESIYYETDLASILQKTVNDVGRFTKADRCILWEYDSYQKSFIPVRHEYLRHEGIESVLEKEHNVNEPALINRLNWFEVVMIPDTSQLAALSEHDKKIIEDRKIKSLLQVPVRYKDKFMGLLRIHMVIEKHSWDDETIALVKNIVTQIAIAIRQAQYIKKLQQVIEDLQESEERFRNMADSSPIMIWVTDENRLTTYVNTTWSDFTKTRKEDLLDLKWKDVIHPDDLPHVEESYIKAFNNRQKWEVESRVKVGENQYKWVLAIGSPRFTPAGHFYGYIGSCIDIDDRKNMEIQLRQAKDLAETASSNKSLFLATMSHELRTPLNSIIGFSEMLEQGYAGEIEDKQRKYIRYIAESGHHLLQLVNDILDISKIESGQVEIALKKVEIEPLVNLVKSMVQDLADKKSITVVFQIQEDLKEIEADPLRLQEIFLNLLSNAIKFNNEHGNVFVRMFITEDNKWMVCEVEDTGIGIPADKIGYLFTPFYQIDSGYSRKHEGTGLGLTLTKQLVELHGGSISVKSTEGVGSVFSFKLPLKHNKAT